MRTSSLALLPGLLALVLAPPAAAAELFWSGYGNVHYMDMDGMPRLAASNMDDGVLQLREFSLFLDAAVDEKLLLSAELEGSMAGSAVQMNYAYLEYALRDGLALRAGRLLVPFLRYNEEKPNFRQNLMSPPFTASFLAPVVHPNTRMATGIGWSDMGASLEWQRVTDRGVVVATAGVFNGLAGGTVALDGDLVSFADGTPGGPVRPRDGLAGNEAGSQDNNADKAVVARLRWQAPRWPLGFGLSAYGGAWDPAGQQRLELVGLDLRWRGELLDLRGEYGRGFVEQVGGQLPVGAADLMPNYTTGDHDLSSLWLEAAWRGLRFDRHRWLSAIVRYDEVDTNDEAMFTPFDRHRWTLGSEWQFHSNARLRFEWQRARIHDFAQAPSMVADSLEEEPTMSMLSLIAWF